MRIYVPAAAADLAEPDGLPVRWAHAVTPALTSALPDEDEEGLAEAAVLAAADESVTRLRERGSAVPRRVVVAADVPENHVHVAVQRWSPDDDRLPSAVELTAPVTWRDVVSIHVDEPGAAEDVAAAVAGDDDALERAAERDLLWYDVVELDALRRELGE
ncbi:DUF6912 family protein [Georgenia wangjunii]|uniref:DUF6912 family protein n=1 Tax=Georgenia wangjunii TaxID=3117730 RepID=UPI002F25F90D